MISFITPLLVGSVIFAFLVYSDIKKEASRMTLVDAPMSGSIDYVRPISQQDNIIGSSSSSVAIITYGDTECPYTKEFFFTMQELISEYSERGVAWVFRHFPNNTIHSRARDEAEAAECAGRVGGRMKFWNYIQALFEKTQSHDSLSSDNLTTIASELALPMKEFEECRHSHLSAARVSYDAENAMRIGAKGTPTSVILLSNGKRIKIDGFASYDKMKSVIDEALLSMY